RPKFSQRNRRRGSAPGCWRSISTLAASISRPYGTPAGQTVSHARQSRQSKRCFATESLSDMRPSASDLIVKMRPRGESISVPSSEKVGQYARQSPQWTHWLTPSTESPWRFNTPAGAGADVWVGVLTRASSDPGDEAPGVQDVAGIELRLDPLHDAPGGAGAPVHGLGDQTWHDRERHHRGRRRQGRPRRRGEPGPRFGLERPRLTPAQRYQDPGELGALPRDLLARSVEPHDEHRAARRSIRREPGARRGGGVEQLDR